MNNTNTATPQDKRDRSKYSSVNSQEPPTKIVGIKDPLLTPNNKDLLDGIDCSPGDFYQAKTVTLKDPVSFFQELETHTIPPLETLGT